MQLYGHFKIKDHPDETRAVYVRCDGDRMEYTIQYLQTKVGSPGEFLKRKWCSEGALTRYFSRRGYEPVEGAGKPRPYGNPKGLPRLVR